MNADDFGKSDDINEAVRLAYQHGLLTSASLMVNGEAAGGAIALAKENPGLAVGLHLVLTGGRASLPPERIPHLVDPDGFFKSGPLSSGLRFYFDTRARKELTREIQAQFERFSATGLPLSHVDGHLHMHLHPMVFKILLPLAEQYDARGIRIPRDDFGLAIRYDRKRLGTKLAWAITFGLLSRWGSSHLRNSDLVQVNRVYGLLQSGNMEEAYVLKIVREMQDPTAEIYFHPTTGVRTHEFGSNQGDLASLLSPAVRRALEERLIRVTTYPDLLVKSPCSSPC
jgi:hopanoid biosynthesis associated protein HpnK